MSDDNHLQTRQGALRTQSSHSCQTSGTTMHSFSDFRPVEDGPAIYQQLADEIHRRVTEGELTPGDRLPPQREFARMVGVNLSNTLLP